MKFTLPMFAICLLTLSFACGKSDLKTVNQMPKTQPTMVPESSIPKDGNYNGRGQITKIDLKLGSVELNHEDIPGVMSPMTMEFYVRDKSHLTALKVGDTVDFVLEYKQGTEKIISLKKTQ